jgi:hypothetical protein
MAEFERPSKQEEEYFAREEVEKKRRLALRQAQELEELHKQELKQLHYMKCPNCGMDLHTLKRGLLDVNTCFNCQGIWLNAGGLEELTKKGPREGGAVIKAVLNIFKRKPIWEREEK